MNENNSVIIPEDEFKNLHSETGLTVERFTAIRSGFAGHFTELASILEAAKSVTVLKPKAARAIRLELRALRSAADKTRKELKDNALKEGRAIDGLNKVLIAHASPVEDEMEAIEKAEEIAAAKAREVLAAARADAIRPYADPSIYPLADLTAEQFVSVFETLKAAHERKLEQERQQAEAEAKRAAEEAAERERLRADNERMRLENERLAKVAADERTAREQAEKDAKAEADRLAAIAAHEAAERELLRQADYKREQEAAQRREQERQAERDEEAKKLAAIEAFANAERERMEKAIQVANEAAREAAATAQRKETEAKAKAEVEHAAKVKVEQDEAARVEKARKKALAAPDKEKLRTLASLVRVIPVPKLSDGNPLQAKIAEQVAKFAGWLETEAEKIQ